MGWAPLVGRPADYLPPGTVGQWLPAPCNGGTCKRAATPEPSFRRRGRLGPRAGILKRKRPNCHSEENSQNSVGGISAKGEGPKDPGVAAPLASAGCRGNRLQDPSGWTARRFAVMESSSSLRQREWLVHIYGAIILCVKAES